VTFDVSQKTLERLEWPQLLARLRSFARTPRGVARLEPEAPPLFEPSAEAVRERLEETSEARAILARGDAPPLGGVADLAASLRRARKGGVLSAQELLAAQATLTALRDAARFLALRQDQAPRLVAIASGITEHRELILDIDAAIDPSGEVRDAASLALAEARREARGLAAEIQQRLARTLQDPTTRSHLSDGYYTVRNDRFVLPVRSDARTSVRGIVHAASRSGTTLFIEPDALVELNNRHRQAEIEIERETFRVLRDLSGRIAEAAGEIETDLSLLEAIDLAFARAHLAEALRGVQPEVGDEGVLHLPQLRHPILPVDQAVPNDVRLGAGIRVLILSGPNAGGKTVLLKAMALAALFVRAGLLVPADEDARVDLFDAVLADIGDEQDIRESLSTFSAHMANLARIAERAGPRTLVVLDEVGVGTDPGEGASLAQAVLEGLADAGACIVATTHFNLLKELAEVDPRFANASVEFDQETLAPTYRLRMGLPGSSSATAVAARMGLPRGVLDRANALLEREDRRLDRMLSELATSRVALEREQREAKRLRAESEAARSEYRVKLERLQTRRDKLYRAMRDDLDRGFRDAHEQVAAVVRDLQRGGSARDAARARQRLQELERRAQETEVTRAPDADSALDPVDWRFAKPGEAVRIRGAGTATLLALPDRRGRVAVRLGSARVLVPVEQVAAAEASGRPPARPRISIEPAAGADPETPGGSGRCDLRGLRVDDALDRLVEALDRAAAAGEARLVIVHGVGTGALSSAVRQHLAESPYVSRFEPGAPDEGGAGVTRAELR
jgi:DNA mismatch repair protein MutS2